MMLVAERLPTGQQGIASVERVTVTQDQAMLARLRDRIHVMPGEYTRLLVHGQIMMSDTQMEQQSNRDVIINAHGKVLIAGLGIGMILPAILKKACVESVRVIELHSDVIDLVAAHYEHPKLTVEQGDIRTYQPTEKFNVVYFDIWPDIYEENLKEIAKLHQRGKYWLDRSDPNCWMSSWQVDLLRALRRQG